MKSTVTRLRGFGQRYVPLRPCVAVFLGLTWFYPVTAQGAITETSGENAAAAVTAQLSLRFGGPVDVDWNADNAEILFRSESPIDDDVFDGVSDRYPEWISYIVTGYDTALIVLRDNITATVHANGAATEIVFQIKLADPTGSVDDGLDPAQQSIRLDLLRAELDRRSGRLIEARRNLRGLMDAHPENFDVLMQLASLETELDRPEQAIFLYNRALALRTGDETALASKRAVLSSLGTLNTEVAGKGVLGVETTVQQVRDADRQAWVVTNGSARVNDMITAKTRLEHRNVKARDVRRENGAIEGIAQSKLRAEIGGDADLSSDVRAGGALYAADSTFGFGLNMRVKSSRTGLGEGTSDVEVEFFKPYWGFVETFAENGTRSRVRAFHDQTVTDQITVYGGASLNRYGMDGARNAADTLGLEVGVSYAPTDALKGFVLDYSIDGEYILSQKRRIDSDRNEFRPVPVVLRETHTLQALYGFEIAKAVNLLSYGGFVFDRYNARGLFGGIAMTYSPNDSMALSLRGDHNITSSRGDDAIVQRFGADFQWRY